MKKHLQNHLRGQICPVLTVGWLMLSDFVVEGWKLDFCDSSRVKIRFFLSLFWSSGPCYLEAQYTASYSITRSGTERPGLPTPSVTIWVSVHLDAHHANTCLLLSSKKNVYLIFRLWPIYKNSSNIYYNINIFKLII